MGLAMKNPIFKGVYEKPIYRGDCLKRGVWTVCRFKRRGLGKKKRGGIFEEGVDIPMHIMEQENTVLIQGLI